MKFLRKMDERFRLMTYDGTKRVEMVEFMLRGLA